MITDKPKKKSPLQGMPDVDKIMESIDAEKLAASMAGMEMPEMNLADIGSLMGMMGEMSSGKVNE